MNRNQAHRPEDEPSESIWLAALVLILLMVAGYLVFLTAAAVLPQ